MPIALHRPRFACLLLAAGLVVACSDDGEESPTGAASATGTGAGEPSGPSSSGSGGGGGTGGGAGGVQIPGVEGEVTATTDEHGVLHLACENDDDCFAALGWFHAQNRFFFMDFVRNLVRGSLGSLVEAGPIVLQQDYANRRFFTTRAGEPLEEALYAQASDRVRGHLDAYSRGVNAWIEDMKAGENGATLTTEYDFELIVKEAIREWQPEDSAAVGLYVLNDLSNNSPGELSLAANLPMFDPAFAADLYSAQPVWDAFTIAGGANANANANGTISPLVHDRLAPARSLFDAAATQMQGLAAGAKKNPGDNGSNNWVVGPGRTAGGNAILANDPHLSLTNPSIWFPAEIDAKSGGDGDYHMAGGTFPGVPAVFVGHNETIAWAVTTAYWDLADVYVEELTADGSAVIFEGEEVAILEKEFSFADALSGETKTQTFRWVPHHGPIVQEDLEAGTALSVRWRGHDGGTDLDAFFALGRAASVDEARDELAEFATSANQNFMIADSEGNIGWFPFSRVPERPWASPEQPAWLPVPGDGSAEWGDPVPFDDFPQLRNPASGVIATANQDLTGAAADGDPTNDGQAALQTRSKAEGARQQRILDVLADGGDEHSVATMTALQGDTFSLFGELGTPLFLEVAEGATLSADEQALVDALAGWDFTCPTGLDGLDPAESPDDGDADVAAASIGCTAFHVAWFALAAEATADEYQAAGVTFGGGAPSELLARLLLDPASVASGELVWDDVTSDAIETREEIVQRAIARAAEVLAAYGAPNDWRWGRVHTLSLRSIYDNFGVTTYNDGPYATPGGLSTVNVATPAARVLPEDGADLDFAFAHGASIRLVTEMTADGPRMQFQLPGGADLHRESDFYNNLLPAWLVNEPVDFAFGPGAVEDPASVVTVRGE